MVSFRAARRARARVAANGPARMLDVVADLDFAKGGNGRALARSGWSDAQDSCLRSIGYFSTLSLDLGNAITAAYEYLIELDVLPFLRGASLVRQRLAIRVRDRRIALDALESAGRTTLGYVLDHEDLGSAPVTLEFRYPDAKAPSEFGLPSQKPFAFNLFRLRVIRLAYPGKPARTRWPALPALGEAPRAPRLEDPVRAMIADLTGLEARDLALRFESLGRNCEFGLVQSRLGAEPIGLLRFNLITLPLLIEGLECGFADADDEGQIDLMTRGDDRAEYFLTHARYKFVMHTRRYPDMTERSDVKSEMVRAARFMKAKLLQTLLDADRIFVFQQPGRVLAAQARPLLARLQAYGPNHLLFVTEDSRRKPGEVDDLGGGLLHGAIDRLAPPGQIGDINLAAWVSLCVNAVRAVGARSFMAEPGPDIPD